ncbi:response regulator [Variovorax sp. HJSM1_2]|uniref:response regulator n=1 Tax=Variovorax sp. HJSM1_2 TaxID=3366263 RepID=UPI003BE0DE90
MPQTESAATLSSLAPPSDISKPYGLTRIVCLLVTLLGLAVLYGWAFGLPLLRSVIPGAVEMKANTALGLVASAAALALMTLRRSANREGRAAAQRSPLAAVLSAAVAILGLLTLAEYAFDWNPGLDEWLFKDSAAAFNTARGRMSPYSAVAFVLLGSALMALPYRGLSLLGRGASAVSVAIGLVSFLGYLWNISEIVTDRMIPPVAVHTALCFILLGSVIYLWSRGARTNAHTRTRSRLENLVLGGFIPAALFVLVGGGLTFRANENFAETAQLVAHTQEVRAELSRVYSALAAAELARRNQMLTNDSQFAEDFHSGAKAAREHLDTLAGLIKDNPAQLQQHRQLADLTERRLKALDTVAQVFLHEGGPAAQRALRTEASERLMAKTQDVIEQMDQAEETLLNLRLQRAQSQRHWMLGVLIATLALLSGVFIRLFRNIRQEVLARGEAEDRLQRLNAELEDRVLARTAELEVQQSFLRRVIDLNRNRIFAKDFSGRFVLANAAMAEAYGLKVEEIVGRTESEFNPDKELVRQFQETDQQVIASGEELVIAEQRVRNAEGETRWVSTVKRPILALDGKSTILLGVSTDITERKAATDELRSMALTLERRVQERTLELRESNAALEQARLESDAASRAKSAFLANMSHEIRTPMNAIIGLTHLMTRETRDAMQRDRLDKVSNAAQHLLQIINDILDISKIEAGKLTLDDREFSLDELLSDATELVAAQGRDKGLEMILDQDHLPHRVRGDPTRLSQILINLLANAVKFTERGWVRLRGELLAEEGQRVQLRFEVQDTGPGIDEERQRLLFNAFEQGDNSSSRRHGGTGLGLALSRQLARSMGGDAGVQSVVGSGSMFWFTVTLTRVAQAQNYAPAPVSLAGLRALLVDDLPEAQAVIGDRLRQMGLKVDACGSGAEAVQRVLSELAAGRAYDVFLIDWRMEPMDGIETLKLLRERVGDGMPPSILITAFDQDALVRRAREARFDAVMLKPIEASALLDQLMLLLRKQPLAELAPASQASSTELTLQQRHTGQRILLAEDNPVNRELAQDLLQMAGLVVETAEDGQQAVEMALSRPYDVVLMDVQMPLMDGMEATRAIRSSLGQADQVLPIIAMTANAFLDDRQACLDAGMNDHVAKPVNPELLYATLLRWLPPRDGAPADGAIR